MIVYDCHVCIKLSGAFHCQQETWHIFCKELFYLRAVFFSCRESISLSSLSCCWPKQAHVWKLVLHINHLLNQLVVIVHSVISFKKNHWIMEQNQQDYIYYRTRTLGCWCPTPIWWRRGLFIVITCCYVVLILT